MISFSVLGSGSRGNSTLVMLREDDEMRCILVDCGLSPRQTAKRLGPLGVKVSHLTDILVTHFDADHFCQGWGDVAEKFDITVRLHQRHRNRAVQLGLGGRPMELFRDTFPIGARGHVEPVLFAHDALGTVGYVIEHDGARLGLATDLGRTPRVLFDQFVDLHALAIESNYDKGLQVASDRPDALKRRIMGGSGHLSNEESIDAVRRIADQSRLAHVVTLHLSTQCNEPRIVKQLYARRLPHLLDRLTVSTQDEATPLLALPSSTPVPRILRPGAQLDMFDRVVPPPAPVVTPAPPPEPAPR